MTKIISIILFFITTVSFANDSFEGQISFRKITKHDTTYFSYIVKNELVRVDEYNKHGNILNSLIVNTNDTSLIAISAINKMYMYMPVSLFQPFSIENLRIRKTEETESFFNYSCKKWIVKNLDDNITVEYFVANDYFLFFVPFLKITNRSEKSALFFIQIPNNQNSFPMKSVEKDENGNELLTLEVIDILDESISDEQFEVPDNYILFQH
ncbi:MAG: DUF4412 domain-containing protein [Bacteroidales bacterium]|nr:DUF4412 domain-containing protein [Bacteroidales bacterium]